MPSKLVTIQLNYVEEFEQFFEKHKQTVNNFKRPWKIDLIAYCEITPQINNNFAYKSIKNLEKVKRVTWEGFLFHVKKLNEESLDVLDLGRAKTLNKNN